MMKAKIVGVLRGKEVRENELTNDILCDADYAPIRAYLTDLGEVVRCEYCQRKAGSENTCRGCGAPLG